MLTEHRMRRTTAPADASPPHRSAPNTSAHGATKTRIISHTIRMATKVEPFYTEVGRRVRDHRKKAGITQERLGRLLSPPTTRVSVANIEGGNQRILSHTLVQLAAALNIEVTDILPQKPETSVVNNSSQIADELVTKLGISVSAAKKLAEKAKKHLNPWERL